MVDKESVSALLGYAYECLKNADLTTAGLFLDKALEVDFEHPEVLFALKCYQFWAKPLEQISGIQTLIDKGDFALQQWKGFLGFLAHISGDFEITRYAFKRMLFGLALEYYLSIPDDEKEKLGRELDLRIGICRKALGDYETALNHFERALRLKKDDARVLAELADTHALSGEQRLSKALFREAFFLSPDKIDVDLLESDMIRLIIEKVRALGFSGKELSEWLPVHAELMGLFNIKRELTPSELARLNSSAFQLENDLRENPVDARFLKPRLLNRYFWLADHYFGSSSDKSKYDQILLKIRLLDHEIYKQYAA
jgi:tetratricopeptide (TPR) repeat protein